MKPGPGQFSSVELASADARVVKLPTTFPWVFLLLQINNFIVNTLGCYLALLLFALAICTGMSNSKFHARLSLAAEVQGKDR